MCPASQELNYAPKPPSTLSTVPVTNEEQHAGCDFFRLAEALQRVLLALEVGEVAVVVRVHVGVDRARLQHVDGDATGAEVTRRALGVADDGSLGGDIVGEAGERGAGRNIGADRDDAAAFTHQLRRRADRGDDAFDIHGTLPGQCRGVGVGIIDRAADGNAGIVDEDVEPAEILGDVLHQLVDIDGGRLVGFVSAGVDALGFQLGDDGFGLVGGGDITDRDVGAFCCESAGASRADAARTAGDEGYLA